MYDSSKVSFRRPTLKKVLVVDDNEQIQLGIVLNVPEEIKVISAYTIPQAERMLEKHPDIEAIAMDGSVPNPGERGGELNTVPLVQKIRETFDGPIIAMSAEYEFRTKLIAAGCDYECEKDRITQKLCDILGLDYPDALP